MEISAQLTRFHYLFGHRPSHVDGHQHVHVFPRIREVFCQVMRGRFTPPVRPLTRLPIVHDSLEYEDGTMMEFLNAVSEFALSSKALFDESGLR